MEDKKPRKELVGWLITGLGIGGTVAYLFLLDWLVNGRWMEIRDGKLNDLGDFLAGAFGPLAIWWLVLGYFQQGIELRQNSAALKLQADELAASVAEQRKLAETAQKQLDSHQQELDYQKQRTMQLAQEEKARVRPKLNIQHAGNHMDGTTHVISLRIANNGSYPCTNYAMHFEPVETGSFTFDRLDPGVPVNASIRLSQASTNSSGFIAWATFNDGHGDPGIHYWDVMFISPSRAIFKDKVDALTIPTRPHE